MENFHNLGIIHKDLKMDNIFVNSDAFGQIIVKIGDFGTSFKIKNNKSSNTTNYTI